MTDETGSTGGEAFTVTELPADAPESFNSPSEAAAYFTSLLEKPEKEQPAERAEAATAEPELSVEDNADPVTDPGETEEVEAAEPPIDRPKSWSKDEDAEWQSLPRTMQQKIVARELERDTGTVRSQQKAAEAVRAAEAKAAQAEQARQSYETRQAEYTKALETALQADFGDIQSLADVRKLQAEDPFRFQAWQVRQMELSAAQAEKQNVDQRKAGEQRSSWEKFVQDESKAFADDVPDYKAKKDDYDRKAADTLRDLGFTDQELNKLASGEEKIPLFDRRIQRLLFDRIRLSEIQSAPKALAAKPLPPVQRPGTSKPAGAVTSERVQALNRKPELTVKEATELYELEHRSTRRAS